MLVDINSYNNYQVLASARHGARSNLSRDVTSPTSRPLKPVPLRHGLRPSTNSSDKSSKHLLWILSPSVTTETIDPQTLLTEEDLSAPVACELVEGKAKKRKTCKNCSCGLDELGQHEAEETRTASAAAPTPPTSNRAVRLSPEQRLNNRARLMELGVQIERGDILTFCAKCAMGDAFRCSNCPYLGLPAFTPGQKVDIDFGDSGERGVV